MYPNLEEEGRGGEIQLSEQTMGGRGAKVGFANEERGTWVRSHGGTIFVQRKREGRTRPTYVE